MTSVKVRGILVPTLLKLLAAPARVTFFTVASLVSHLPALIAESRWGERGRI